MQITKWFFITVYLMMYVHGAKILGIFPLPRESSFIMYGNIMKALAEKGHDVDVVSYFPQKNKIPRYNDMSLQLENNPEIATNLTVSVVENYEFWRAAMYIFKECGSDMCNRMSKHPTILNLTKSKTKYDLFITEVFTSDCLLGFGSLFQVPTIGVSSEILTPWLNDRMGNPDNPSYMPNYLLPYGSKMFLYDRIWNAVSGLLYKIGYYLFSLMPSEMRAREIFGPDLIPIDVLSYNISIILINSHFSVNFPRPLVPNIIEVAGLHIDTPKSLPMKLDKFTKSTKPLIYVSLQTDVFSPEKLKIIIDALGNLNNPIIWNGKNISGKYPDNMYIDDYKLKRIDVLCNSNTALYITNGDIFLMQESMYCGVPVVGIPVTAEHSISLKDAETRGFGIDVKYDTLTKENLLEAINTILKNNTYKQHANKQSEIFKDRPVKPLNEAVYWIEYVIRHKGAKHLRTVGADMIWLEYYNIDTVLVFGVIGFVGFLMALIFIYLFLPNRNSNDENDEISKKDN